MITQKEFLEIIEKHLVVRNDGTVVIPDPKLAKKYQEYLKQFATKEEPNKFWDTGCSIDNGCGNNVSC
jgi:hypothetical protein